MEAYGEKAGGGYETDCQLGRRGRERGGGETRRKARKRALFQAGRHLQGLSAVNQGFTTGLIVKENLNHKRGF